MGTIHGTGQAPVLSTHVVFFKFLLTFMVILSIWTLWFSVLFPLFCTVTLSGIRTSMFQRILPLSCIRRCSMNQRNRCNHFFVIDRCSCCCGWWIQQCVAFLLPMCNNQLFYHCATFIKDYWLEHLQIKQYSAKMLRFLILIITNYNKNNLV